MLRPQRCPARRGSSTPSPCAENSNQPTSPSSRKPLTVQTNSDQLSPKSSSYHDSISPSWGSSQTLHPRDAILSDLTTPRTPVLQIRTDVPALLQPCFPEDQPPNPEPQLHASRSTTDLPRRAPSIRSILAAEHTHSSAGSLSPGSAFSSPQIAALSDITPLPSPIQLGSSSWRSGSSYSLSRVSSNASYRESQFGRRGPDNTSVSRSSSAAHRPPGSSHGQLRSPQEAQTSAPAPERSHTRNRSLSEYVPAALIPPQPRKATFSSAVPPPFKPANAAAEESLKSKLQREEYLAVRRGIAPGKPTSSTPPSSMRRGDSSSDSASYSALLSPEFDSTQIYDVRSIRSKQPRRYRGLRQLGQGAFSQVTLAVREEGFDDQRGGKRSPPKLVAVKIVEYGPAGGVDEERVEVSLNREVDILKSINHPSLVQLKAFGSSGKKALLVLDYCPGGDLFEFASQCHDGMAPSLIRRIFTELVDAVRYLHRNQIVHRDIKLENVLVNMPLAMMQDVSEWQHHAQAAVTLTDLGLSRRIPQPPESPLLHTRCGSEDYAAPEILMGQPYDGRSTDAWALGVLLYAIMETRLPFDALPGTRGDPAKLRARTPHRIARCEWSWYVYADEDGEWDPAIDPDLEGGRLCVEGLLRRSTKRTQLDEIAQMEWVHDAIDVPDGLRRGDIEVP